MARYTDNELGHADEADGIEEYDNPLPDWWVGLFFVSMAWGVAYAANFHFISHDSQAGWYDEEIALAKATWPELDKPAALDESPETLAVGKETFEKNCASCHTPALTGGIGPNLIDDAWIHGGAFADISNTIDKGVAAKGMPSWGAILGPKTVAAVASYVLSKNEGEAGRAKNTAMGAYANVGTPADGTAEAPAEGAPTPTPAEVEIAVPAVLTPEAIAAGQAVFTERCVACHGPELKGGVGPDLTDDTWIHGGELADIQKTITTGVPDKGMITWKGVITDQQIAEVAAFVYSKGHPTE